MLVSLVGLPGVGKSTIGRQLARRLDFAFADCDALIEARLQERIRDYFDREGEEAFRDREEAMLAELVCADRTVIATGGGIVLRAANRRVLHERTECVYLHAQPADLFGRLRRDTKRPLLQVADPLARLRELSAQREPLYRESAWLVVGAAGVPRGAVIETIIRALARRTGSTGVDAVDGSVT
ncbi:MAG: shikimate kinase [Caldimonas sp.]